MPAPPDERMQQLARLDSIRWMRHAARLATRGHGGAEPNPCVGCVIVGQDGVLLGEGLHRRCGGAHAEIEALADARRRGHDVRGATMFVTLEPCRGTGRTGPCTEAVIAAGIGRVVVALRDPHAKGRGGLERLREAGVATEICVEPASVAVGAPFVHRAVTGLPWVVAKWAQTLDGRIATRGGESRWISSERSRAMVHRERGRVDAILTGIGTVLADDPLLTARGVRCRRVARRVVVDPRLRLPLASKLVESLGAKGAAPLSVACGVAALTGGANNASGVDPESLRALGVELIPLPPAVEAPGSARPQTSPHTAPQTASPTASPTASQVPPHSGPVQDRGLALAPLLRHLAQRHDVATLLVEAGPRLLGSLFAQDLVDEAWIFVAPLLLGDREAPGAVEGLAPTALAGAARFSIVDQRRRGPDLMLRVVRRR